MMSIKEIINKTKNCMVVAMGAKYDYKKWSHDNFYEIVLKWIKTDRKVVFLVIRMIKFKQMK